MDSLKALYSGATYEMYAAGIYFAVKVKNQKVKLLWSMCRADKGKKLKKSQHKSHLWKGIAESYETGYQIGKFPSEFENGYDAFWTNWHFGKATRRDKNGRKVCEYENVNTGDMYIEASPKITKLCTP